MNQEPEQTANRQETNAAAEKKGTLRSISDGLFRGHLPFRKPTEEEVPTVDNYASDEAFEKFKEHNVNVTLRTGSWGRISSLLDRFGTQITMGTVVAIGTAVGTSGASLAPLAWTLLAGIVLTLASFSIAQFIRRDQSENNFHQGEYRLRRETTFVGKEVGQNVNTPEKESNNCIKCDDSPRHVVMLATNREKAVEHATMQAEQVAADMMRH